MSVLIKGMEMPTKCGKCFVGDRSICKYGCPLVDIPTPHGRLIDADELKLKKYHSCVAKENVVAVAHIDWSPTVIEAEE